MHGGRSVDNGLGCVLSWLEINTVLIKSGRGTGPVKPDNRFLKKDLVSIPAREDIVGEMSSGLMRQDLSFFPPWREAFFLRGRKWRLLMA